MRGLKISTLFFAFIVGINCNSSVSFAATKIAPDLQEAALDAAIIAKIAIEREERLPCGYVYTARVIDSLKGARVPFKFFSSMPIGGVATRSTFLAFVYEIDLTRVTSELNYLFFDVLSSDQKAVLGCRVATVHYASTTFESILPIKKGEDGQDHSADYIEFAPWNGPPQIPPIQTCEIRTKPFIPMAGHNFLFEWRTLRRGILDLLHKPRGLCDF